MMVSNDSISGIETAGEWAKVRRLAEELLAYTKEPGQPSRPALEEVQVRQKPGDFGYAILAAQLYRERTMRGKFFGGDLFGEPAWNILLDLFVHQHKGRQVSVTSACIASQVPPTTALRWINLLVDEGLIERVGDPADRRRALLALSKSAILNLNGYLEALGDRFGEARSTRL